MLGRPANESFAMIRRDDLWIEGALREERRAAGEATRSWNEISARDRIADPALWRELTERCDAAMDSVRGAVALARDARVRAIATASTEGVEVTMTVTLAGISIVTAPEQAEHDIDALRNLLAERPGAALPGHVLPIVWRNGSAAVLLHEAAGHAAEAGHAPAAWPSWLQVRDDTGDGRSSDLLAAKPPLRFRRESFRDVPLRRMTALVAEQGGAPFELPRRRIEVHLLAGGGYDPLAETVSLSVAVADLVDDAGARRLPAFALHARRGVVARSLAGASGDPVRYPGVICSREGQEIFVASRAPVMLTVPEAFAISGRETA